MRLRTLKVGCFGGGTGLPSLLGGLKAIPWVELHAVVTMFDSGGSSGQLRDELGVLPPGDVLKCTLTLARNEREARKILLARLPMLEHGRLAGHTGGNLLLSMMEQYTGDFIAAVDGLRTLLGCRGHVWPITVERVDALRALRGRLDVARRNARGRGADGRPGDRAAVAGPARVDPPGGRAGDSLARRGRHRPGQLLYEPAADSAGRWLPRRAGRRCAGRSSTSRICSPRAAACTASRPATRSSG